ncbi:MAG: hypothetical protein O6922_00015 [Chloroflexi bacterium]|nr:hypothetical protein [Chloroflexota bacterium]
MKKSSLTHRLFPNGGIIGLVFFAVPVFAEDAGKVEELRRVIEAQQQQLEMHQKQLDTQRQLLQKLEAQLKSLDTDADQEEVPVAAETPSVETPTDSTKVARSRGGGLSDEGRHDLDSPTGASVSYTEPAVTLAVPSTNTEIGLNGFAQFQIIHDSDGMNSNEFNTIAIPVNGAPSQTKFNVNPSRFGITSATGLGYGRINTLISIDLNGQLDSPELRLREAYGEFIHDELDFAVLGGQTFTTTLDLKSVPETLDFAGPTGYFARRQPLLRFSKLFDHKVRLDVAAETPENAVITGANLRTRWPNFVVAGAWDVSGEYVDHVRLAGLVSDLNADDTFGNSGSALGWAISGSGKVRIPFLGERDNFKFGIQYGEGFGGQIKSGPADAEFNPVTGELETIGVFSTYGGVQHFWSDSFRSNLVYGYVDADNPGFIAGDSLENTSYFAADIIWAPYKTVTVGAEYLWGRRQNKDGAAGTANRILFSSKFEF